MVEQDNNHAGNRSIHFALYAGDLSTFIPLLYTIGSPFIAPVDFSENIMITMSRKVAIKEKLSYTINDYDISIHRNGTSVNFRGQPVIPATEFETLLRTHSLLHLSKKAYIEWCNTLPINPPNPEPPKPVVSKVWNIVAIILEVVFLAIIIVTCFFVNRRKGKDTTTEYEKADDPKDEKETKEKEDKGKESLAQEL